MLVLVRQDSRHTTFTIVDAAPASFEPKWASQPFHSTKPNHMGLGIPLTRRDVALLDGKLAFRTDGDATTRAVITVPNEANANPRFEFHDRFAPEATV